MNWLNRIICRIFGHDWVSIWHGEGLDYTVERVCIRCGEKRTYNRLEAIKKIKWQDGRE